MYATTSWVVRDAPGSVVRSGRLLSWQMDIWLICPAISFQGKMWRRVVSPVAALYNTAILEPESIRPETSDQEEESTVLSKERQETYETQVTRSLSSKAIAVQSQSRRLPHCVTASVKREERTHERRPLSSNLHNSASACPCPADYQI